MNWLKRFWAFANRLLLDIFGKKADLKQQQTVAALSDVLKLEEFMQKARALTVGQPNSGSETANDPDSWFSDPPKPLTYREKYSACKTCKGRWWIPHLFVANGVSDDQSWATGVAYFGCVIGVVSAGFSVLVSSIQGIGWISLVTAASFIGSISLANIGFSVNRRRDHRDLMVRCGSTREIGFEDALKQVFESESWADQQRLIGDDSDLHWRLHKLRELSDKHGESIAFLELRVSEERAKNGEDGIPSYLQDALEKTKKEHEAAQQGCKKIVKIMDSLRAYFEREREKVNELFQPIRDLEQLKEIEVRGVEISEAIEQANKAATNAIIDVHTRRKAFAETIQNVCELRLIEKGSEVATNLDYYDATMEELVRLGVPRLTEEDPIVEPVT